MNKANINNFENNKINSNKPQFLSKNNSEDYINNELYNVYQNVTLITNIFNELLQNVSKLQLLIYNRNNKMDIDKDDNNSNSSSNSSNSVNNSNNIHNYDNK